MADQEQPDITMEDDYDEEADSDFQADGSGAEDISASSADEESPTDSGPRRPRKRRKIDEAQNETTQELDSGDEATIRQQKKTRGKHKKNAEGVTPDGGNESEGWRARTRAMRTKDKEERKRNKLASSKGSTIDVAKIWEEMNRQGSLPPPRIESDGAYQREHSDENPLSQANHSLRTDVDKENVPAADDEETITIKRTYKFAGEVHVEEKMVLKSSAEAQLWLAQQQSSKSETPIIDGKVVNRPLRKISRFDPNFSNMDAFKGAWVGKNAQGAKFKGPKLNVVEKSKMDWAVHVDTEGLKEELDTHAKAKEGYLNRMDFLRDVEDRKEAEARVARIRGR